jgi:hypothetical protein
VRRKYLRIPHVLKRDLYAWVLDGVGDGIKVLERLSLVPVLGNDGVPVLVPLFLHGVPTQARIKRQS